MVPPAVGFLAPADRRRGPFGLGFGIVGQVLIVAVQNSVDCRQLGLAMAATNFFGAPGGAVCRSYPSGRYALRTIPRRQSGPRTRACARPNVSAINPRPSDR